MSEWQSVCTLNDILPGTGVCALLGSEQVAIFRDRKHDELYAIANYDPIGEANVLSRGIIGSIGDELVVASPLYKQHFSLASGDCIEDAAYKVKTYPVRINDNNVQLKSI